MSRTSRGMALFFSSLMVLSVLGAGVAFAGQGVQNPSNIPDSQVFAVSDDGQVEGWERAAYTLRTDDTTAAAQVTSPSVVQGERLGSGNSFTSGNDGVDSKELVREFNGQRNPIGVHNNGENVNIAFDADLATSGTYDQLDNEDNVQLVAARLTPQDGKGVPDTTEQALDLFSSVSNANANATFQMVETNAQLGGSGELSTTDQFNPGNYVIFAAVRENSANGFEVSSGDISVDGDVVLIGMDQLAVQEAEASVTPPSNANPGDDLTFDIDTTNAFSSDVTHAVAVYNASTFEDARFDVVVNESALGNDFSGTDDIQLEHSIDGTNGVADVEDGTTVNGQQLSDGRVSRPLSAASIIDFLAEEAGTEDPSTHSITNGGESNSQTETIDASVTVVNTKSPDTTVTVETFDNFSTGDYRYVVLSTLDSDEQDMSTDTGTITLESESTSGDGDDDSSSGGGGGGGGGAAPPADDDETDNETDSDGPVNVTVPAENVSATETVDIVDADPESPGVTVRTNNTSVTEITFSNESIVSNETAPSNMTVNDIDRVPDEAGDPPGRTVQAMEINVPDNARNDPANITVRVSRDRIDELNASEDELTITRFNESAGEWQELNTSVAMSGNASVLLTGETPGFSVFAVTAPEEEQTTPTPTESTPTPTEPTPTETDTTDDMTTDTPEDTPTETDSETLPGFGAVVALIALLAAALLAMRRE